MSDSKMDGSSVPRSSETSALSSATDSPQNFREWLTSYSAASPVNRSATPGTNSALTIPATCGPQRGTYLATYDHATVSWKTSLLSFLMDTSEPLSVTWPRSGSMLNGDVFERKPPVPRTGENVFSSSELLPTPSTKDMFSGTEFRTDSQFMCSLGTRARHGVWPTPMASSYGQMGGKPSLETRARTGNWGRPPTPLAQMSMYQEHQQEREEKEAQLTTLHELWEQEDQQAEREGQPSTPWLDGGNSTPQIGPLNPGWVEWLMGWPIGITDLKPAGTALSPISLQWPFGTFPSVPKNEP